MFLRTTFQHITIVPSGVWISGKTPWTIRSPGARITTVVVTSGYLWVLFGWQDELVWCLSVPGLAGFSCLSHISSTIVSSAQSSKTVSYEQHNYINSNQNYTKAILITMCKWIPKITNIIEPLCIFIQYFLHYLCKTSISGTAKKKMEH